MCDTEGFNCLFLLFSAGSWALSFISQSASSLLFLCVCAGGGVTVRTPVSAGSGSQPCVQSACFPSITA